MVSFCPIAIYKHHHYRACFSFDYLLMKHFLYLLFISCTLYIFHVQTCMLRLFGNHRNYNTLDCIFSKATSRISYCGIHAGAETYPNSSLGWIHVKDVVNAHILAYENASASGRYCLAERVLHYSDIVTILRQLYPEYKLPEK